MRESLTPKRESSPKSAEQEAIIRQQRLLRVQQGLFKGLTWAILAGVGVSTYASDVRANQEIQASSHARIDVMGDALEKTNNNKALVFIDGFRAFNAQNLTENMSRAIQPVVDGQLWSVDYNNGSLSYKDIAQRIIATAKKQNVTTLSFVGYSAGGAIAMRVQEIIRETSDLTIESIFLISTPDGIKDLRPARQAEIDLVDSIKWIPGIEYSTPLQIIGEMAIRSPNYTAGKDLLENTSNFFKNLTIVQKSLKNDTVPGTWVMFKQLLAIEQANFEDRIKAIQELPATELRPTVVYLGTAKPGYDYMVDNTAAAQTIGSYLDPANIPYFVYNVPGAVHSRPELANDAYIDTVTTHKVQIVSSINRQISLAYGNVLLDRYNALVAPTPPSNEALDGNKLPPDTP